MAYTPQELEELEHRHILNEQFKRGWQRNLANLERMRAQQAADAEQERLGAIAANQPVNAPADTIDITQGLSIKNGKVVARPEVPLSQGAIKTAQLSASFVALRNKQ